MTWYFSLALRGETISQQKSPSFGVDKVLAGKRKILGDQPRARTYRFEETRIFEGKRGTPMGESNTATKMAFKERGRPTPLILAESKAKGAI